MICDASTGGTLTIKRFNLSESSSAVGTDGSISLTSSSSRVVKMDQAGVGVEGPTVSLSFEFASAPAKWKILSADMDVIEVNEEMYTRD